MNVHDSDAGKPAADDTNLTPEKDGEAKAEATEQDEEAEEGEGEEPVAEGDEDKPEDEETDEQKLSRAQRRRARQKAHIQGLETEATRATARAEAAERALAEFREELGPEPKADQYEDPNDYIAAKAAFEADRRAIARQKIAIERGAKTSQTETVQAKQNLFRERTIALADRYPDIEAKVLKDTSLPISQAMAEVMMDSERGPEIGYYLSGRPDEARRITQMQPLQAARELGRIEATLDSPKPRTETKAPPPVPTVRTGVTKSVKDPDKMPVDEWVAYERERMRKKGISR